MLPLALFIASTAGIEGLQSLSGPLLMRHPTVNQTDIVFSFAGDLWRVSRSGGNAVRLTTTVGSEQNPFFSPDGTMVAYTGDSSGSEDVYVVPAEGGEPTRLTYHPGLDIATGWTPDGKSVTFASSGESDTDLPYLYTVSIKGGLPKRMPLPSGSQASLSPDGGHLAYNPGIKWQNAWKRYRGGQASKVWIADLSDSSVREIPRKNSNDNNPMWVDGTVYFLSDRNGPVTLFSFDVKSGRVTELIKNTGFDMKSASAGAGAIAIEQLGEIKLYDLKSGRAAKVEITLTGEFPEYRAQYKDTSSLIGSASLSPSAARAVFEARGDIYTVPAAKGDVRNLTGTSHATEHMPAWSPDGQSICYFSDEKGEYQLVVRDPAGRNQPRFIPLQGRGFYYSPSWSPDSKKVAYADNEHNIWILDIDSGQQTKVDTNPYENPLYVLNPVWSPDSKWLTYFRDLDSHIAAIFLYSLDSGKSTQVTDGLSDARNPVFDNGGKYLYFTASTNSGASMAWLDLSSFRAINTVSHVYAVVLRNDLPSPLAPESDEEKAKPEEGKKPEEKKEAFRIDLERIGQRIIALPMPGKNYQSLAAGPSDSFFAVDLAPMATVTSQPRLTLVKFSFASRSAVPITSDFLAVAFNANGEKMLVFRGANWAIVPTAGSSEPGQGVIGTAGMQALVEPAKEWRQMFHEAWRIQRDFFYAPNFHGIDLTAMERRYEPFVAGIRSREDLNYLFEDMLGELCVGHMYIGGGDIPIVPGVPGGLLGADYSLENGRYRFARVFDGENWNPQLRAPLTQPGVNVKAGEYLLAVNGRNVTDEDNIHRVLEATAGKQVTIKVGPSADGKDSREVVVVPVPGENGLRHLAWIEDNRRKVEKLSNGRLGYMHIPDTNIGGWTNFNRYYYAQVGKEGIIVDERFNHGGQVDDFMVDNMIRPLMSMWTSRYGKDFPSPLGQVYGPKVMIVNEYAGSGGDYFPWHFKKAKVGPVVGKRTWGGLVGILNFPPLLDGGRVTSPNIAFYNPDGSWDVENYGVDPTIEVELDPALWRKGHDAQLERAVEEGMKLLAKGGQQKIKKPAYVDKSNLAKISD